MKVTALISDDLIREAMKYTGAQTVTETLKIALQEYVALQKIKELSASVAKEPLEFKYTSEELRDKNNL